MANKKSQRKSTRERVQRVKDIASDQPKPLQERSTLKEAGEKMRALKADKFPVASGDRLVGIVNEKYPERKAAGFGHDPATTLVRGIMVRKALYCFEDQTPEEAREIMRKNQLKHLPVVDKKLRIIGIVALKDLVLSKDRPRTKM